MTATVDTDPFVAAEEPLARMASLDQDDTERVRLRNDIICGCLPAAHREAMRYRYAGERMEDLAQVAVVGLILAVDRFDPTRNVAFRHFALPTISGELKRHLRDKGWSVRVSRRVKELNLEIRRTEPLLAQRLGRTPTARDVAEALAVDEEDVRSAQAAGASRFAVSLSQPALGDDVELMDTFGREDKAIGALLDHDALRRALPILPPRLATVVSLRFLDELSQAEIGDKIGCSQMHVSRLLDRALTILRKQMTAARVGARRCDRGRKGVLAT
jgi:RNA polymerase sigma-B factor